MGTRRPAGGRARADIPASPDLPSATLRDGHLVAGRGQSPCGHPSEPRRVQLHCLRSVARLPSLPLTLGSVGSPSLPLDRFP